MLSPEEKARRARKRKIQALIRDYPQEVVDVLLDEQFPPHRELELDKLYERRSDDTDGKDTTISAQICSHGIRLGDVFFDSKFDGRQEGSGHCFRGPFGGTASPHVYKAMLILARAIQLDNEPTNGPGRLFR